MSKILDLLSKLFQRICMLDSRLYILFLRKRGVTIGEGSTFFGHVSIDTQRPCLVEIGRNCNLSDGVFIITHGYDWAVLREKFGEMLSSSGKVVLEDNVFIGINSLILKGVRIGTNTIIGAGSVVTHDIPAYCVAAGNPCKVIMTLEEYYKKRKKVYIEEAKAYAWEIYLKTKKIPRITDFREEFPIFLPRNYNRGDLPIKDQLRSAYSTFLTSEPFYKSYQEFLMAAGIPRDKINSTNTLDSQIDRKKE
jgi:acetyltransferase-like isoleucine patch superfamily enzyme